MPRIKSLWWTALIFALCLIKPATGLCLERDRYARRMLVGSLYLEFEAGKSKTGILERDRTRFNKVLTLDFRSWILSRRLMVYDAGIRLEDTDFSSTSGNNGKTQRLSYYLNTTLLPKSRIPLVLHAKRTERSSSATGEDSTSTDYGLRWLGRFRVLPVTTIRADKTSNVGTGIDTSSTIYELDMKKKLGSSDSEFVYNNKADNNRLSDTAYNASSINFTNRTELSRDSLFYIGFTRSDVSASNAPDSAFTGASASFTSHPSADFSQNHSYTSYSSKTSDSTQTGIFYSGSLNYKISQRLTTSLAMAFNNSETVTPSLKARTEGLSTSGFMAYAVMPNLTLTETLTYTDYKATSSDPSTPNLTDRTHLTLLTTAAYAKKFAWTDMSSAYGLGYTEDHTDKDLGGKGVVQTISASLANINFNRYAVFNAGFGDSQTKNLVGNLDDRLTTYKLDALNKVWKEYAVMSANYSRTNHSSWIEATEYTSESYGARATSNYIQNTPISAYYTRAAVSNKITGDTETITSGLDVKSSQTRKYYGFTIDAGISFGASTHSASGSSSSNMKYASVGYSRPLLGGSLSAKWRGEIREASHNESQATTVMNAYTGAYSRPILKRMTWIANVSRTTSTIDSSSGGPTSSSSTTQTTVTNSVAWAFRAWVFSAEHRYLSTKLDTAAEAVETTVIFRVLRTFGIIF
ncbi:MAG: hypothetical protein HZB83_07955 [Deltaproteobacteria bacterium]|nr:hypothetical protein [Deltaproteobacteria bacterium]